jgi:hypothetical protein
LLLNVLENGYVPVAAVAVKARESDEPGGIPAAVPTTKLETVQVTALEVNSGADWRKPPAVAPVMVQPEGASMVKPVIVYELEVGLARVTVNDCDAPPIAGLLPVTVAVGRLPFEAKTGDAMGIKKRRPERARIARIVPELNFVRYAFVGVFIYFQVEVARGYI